MRLKITLAFIFFSIALSISAQSIDYKSVKSKKKGKYTQYTAKNGEIFKIGDTITIRKAFDYSNCFTNIKRSSGFGDTQSLASRSDNNLELTITKIKANYEKAYIYTSIPLGYVDFFIIEIEPSIATGEIKSKVLNSEQALNELKRLNDKLYVEIISQEEYDKKKEELDKHIK